MIERDQITSNLPTASSAVLMTTNVIRPVDAKPTVRMSKIAKEKQRNQPVISEQGLEDFFPEKSSLSIPTPRAGTTKPKMPDEPFQTFTITSPGSWN